ncbi:hypothetical protein [Granulicella mallensis]|uniref:Uncharacterized protein n=1 Tax=Granulicella mallensis (strain ATCC BAA-1857 / DSM 23137 / MP5ACTX8) TaxID=682795 RepID=G8NSE1_GRAMM|nr:hypothetical protein [Granulicella mallensis]AEU37435.1 hypothetical protein AciX8_3132 [Granulicella mallensis MP5ACTX8]
MQHFESQSGQFTRVAAPLGAVLFLGWLAGCSSSPIPATQAAAPPPGVQTYFAPFVDGLNLAPSTLTYTLYDDPVKGTFSQATYQSVTEPGPQVLSAGNLTIGQRGLRSLDITINSGTPLPPGSPEPGSFAVELAGQAGGLVQMVGQPVQPLVAATQCPSSSTQTYQFLTIPTQAWNSTTDTAYGSVEISSSGSDVTFKNISQYILPPAGKTGAPPQPPAQSSNSLVTGASCGPTFFGNITNVPGTLVVTDPGQNGTVLPAQAQIGIGPSGLLVENNGFGATMTGSLPPLDYENVLGAGTGAVGLPKPSSALDTSTVVGKQYLGFIYSLGASSPAVPRSSNLASFGFPSAPTVSTGCPSVDADASSSILIYGGDFPVNPKTGLPDPGPDNSSNPNYPYGNNDFVIDLGPQDTSNNGLYRQAKVCVGKLYPGNSTGAAYPFQAVAIAGQLGSQYAIFLIGQDPTSTQPWAIYLLSSN